MNKQLQCIYCKNQNPFNTEHVFPKSLGGDDKKYLLKEGVCENCNSLFSAFEAKLTRESAIAITRLNAHKTRPPYANPKIIPNLNLNATTTVSSSKYLLDVEFSHLSIKGKLSPQIIIDGHWWEKYIPEGYDDSEFFDKLKDFLSKDFIYVVKKPRSRKKAYFVTKYSFDGRKYIAEDGEYLIKPPKQAFWIEVFYRIEGLVAPYPPRIIKRKENFAIRAEEGEVLNLSILFTEARKMIPPLSNALAPKYSWDSKDAHFQPAPGHEKSIQAWEKNAFLNGESGKNEDPTDDVMYRGKGKFKFTPGDYQVFIKMAFNFLAFEAGLNYVRKKEFDVLRNFAINGSGEERVVIRIGSDISFFGKSPPAESHLVFLNWKFTSYTKCEIFCVFLIYGFFTIIVNLGSNAPIPNIPHNTFFSIDYFNNKISKYSEEEYLKKHMG